MSIEKNNKVTVVTEENFMECMREYDAYYWKKNVARNQLVKH